MMDRDGIAQRLQTTSLFAEVSLDDLRALAQVMEVRAFPVGAIIFKMGDPGDTMYIIQSGRVRISVLDDEEQELTLMHYGASEIFGEFALLDNNPRSASAAAEAPLEVCMLRREDFMNFLLTRPRVSVAMMRSLSQRARYTTHYVEEVVRWAKRLAKGEYSQVIEEIAHTEDTTGIKEMVSA
ncbi:MAG: cyclic nucleotide-binding domain-containing protein, partial [Anaerolineae bacterium]|nr:cyclic nucleotide-binding domain-containing protein [Anaerolineae bacterium]